MVMICVRMCSTLFWLAVLLACVLSFLHLKPQVTLGREVKLMCSASHTSYKNVDIDKRKVESVQILNDSQYAPRILK